MPRIRQILQDPVNAASDLLPRRPRCRWFRQKPHAAEVSNAMKVMSRLDRFLTNPSTTGAVLLPIHFIHWFGMLEFASLPTAPDQEYEA